VAVSPSSLQSPFSFDQSHCNLRYTSPVHLEYLQNMGVRASLIIAIVVGGRLWEMLSCLQQSAAYRLPLHKLTLCHVLSDLASNHIARLEDKRQQSADTFVSAVLSGLSADAIDAISEDHLADVILGHKSQLLSALGADGLQFESETANWIIGDTPTSDQMDWVDQHAHKWLRHHGKDIIATSDLGSFFESDGKLPELSGGLLYLKSWDHKTQLKVFRHPSPQEESWAGDPEAKVRYNLANPEIMHPRNSFEAYQIMAKDRSSPWLQGDIETAHNLKRGLRNIEMSFHKSLRERQLRNSNAKMRNALSKADYEANHDPLTGALNRRGLQALIDGFKPRRYRKDTAWFCHIDLDEFKQVNDLYGHVAGDSVLKRAAQLFAAHPFGDTKVARLGGDEFVILVMSDLSPVELRNACEDLIKRVSAPDMHDGQEFSNGCTIGAAQFSPGDADLETLLKWSDLALYKAKGLGRGRVATFSDDLAQQSDQRHQEEAHLIRGLAQKQFVPFFQAQHDCQTGKFTGYEVLARWEHPDRGMLCPEAFMDLATEMGLLADIDRQVFEAAVACQRKWYEQTGEIRPISVNTSCDRLLSKTLLADLLALGDWAKNISLELLESIDLDDHKIDYAGILQELRQTGVGIEIDDFGTGRTSILAMVAIKPDRLKIDKRLIDPIVGNPAATALVKSVLDIGQQLGIETTAEGVESDAQLELLKEFNCDRAQGFHFAEPLSAASIEAQLDVAA